ncbi:MAG TPA: hypothetical protein RMG48_14545 [Myxococcales bacterium LLY-WYZ-16_1]|nr:hypothetical protein [Myxococcales bacterium LLY-WYZ-16_1]
MGRTLVPLVVASLLVAKSSWAQNVQITLGGEAERAAAALGISTGELQTLASEQIGALYSVNDVQEFLKLSANAQSLLNKGIGVDYASSPTGFLFGIGVSGALDTGESDFRDVAVDIDPSQRAVPVGVGAQISLMIGYNFADQGVPGLTIYANGLGFPLSVDEYEADFYNFGLHGQYKLFGPRGNESFNWGGLDLTSGLEFSQMRLTLRPEDAIEASAPLSSGSSSIILNTAAQGELALVQTAWTVPLEVTTSVTFLYALALYTGIGVDFQFGNASIEANLRDDRLTADLPDGSEADLGRVQISADDENGPTTVLFRVLAGLQVNLGPIKAFGQINLQPENLPDGLTVSAAGGLRAVF